MITKIDGVSQCICGILFDEPHIESDQFIKHLIDGTHRECLNVEICGPCFMGFCVGCDKSRVRGPNRWKCRCMHDFPLIFNNSKVSVPAVIVAWSDWLRFGRHSTVSLGLEEPTQQGETK